MDDTMSVDSNQITLSLNVQTYHQLGLLGQPSILNKKKNTIPKYRVIIDLNVPYFTPNKKFYKRTLDCLKRCNLKFDILIKWQPKDSTVSSSSLEKYLYSIKQAQSEHLSSMTITKCYPTLRQFTNASTIKYSGSARKEDMNILLDEFIEWVGCQTNQIVCYTQNEDKIGLNLSESSHWENTTNMHCVEIRGLFNSHDVIELLSRIESLFSNHEHGAILVHGFENSPQCWKGKNNEHYSDTSGTNQFAIGQFGTNIVSWIVADALDHGIERL